MLNSVLAMAAKWAYGKKFVEGLGWVHDKLDGKKTEIFSALYALSYALEMAGVLPPESAAMVRTGLKPLVGGAFLSRASKVAAALKKVAGQ
jgi:hypothetical protein